MPIFEFRCTDCNHFFEKLFLSPDERVDLSCPECKSQTIERVMSRSNYAVGVGPAGKQPKITTKSCAGGNQCMTLDLPGPQGR
jgi:putative FmdB family regulatory protein